MSSTGIGTPSNHNKTQPTLADVRFAMTLIFIVQIQLG